LSRRPLKRCVFKSVMDLQAAINRFVAETNENPKPFVWTKDPNKIIAAVKKGHQILDWLQRVFALELGVAGFLAAGLDECHGAMMLVFRFAATDPNP
jgi:hypothetical protein